MFPASVIVSNSSTSLSAEEAAVTQKQPRMIKKKRNLPGNPDPEAEVVALSPKTLLATNRFVCEICNKGFQRDQNLQLHRRGHNLPWKLKQRNSNEIGKRVYVCPDTSCVHHHPSRALGDLTGIKKHFCRKHGEKKWKCDKCFKIYAVQSDWKAHSKTCGTREYKCDCGILFSRKDRFITHRAFCDALAEESARLSVNQHRMLFSSSNQESLLFHHPRLLQNPFSPLHNRRQSPQPLNNVDFIHSLSQIQNPTSTLSLNLNPNPNPNPNPNSVQNPIKPELIDGVVVTSSHHLSATALLQKVAVMGMKPVGSLGSTMAQTGGDVSGQRSDRLTRDFLGLTRGGGNGRNVDVSVNRMELLTCTGGVESTPENSRRVKARADPPPSKQIWGQTCHFI